MEDPTEMDFDLGAPARELRERLRALLGELLPDDWTGGFSNDADVQDVIARVCRRLGEERLLTMSWPREYGGADASVWEQTVLREEMWAHFEPRGAQYMGLSWVGPTIMQLGTQAQKDLHLPAIAEGRAVWCQGFSEPGAGSDLAALQLRAERVDDGWLLSGQKVWTSYAGIADWCFLATRTSAASRRHDGITVFLLPMDRPGITVREIDSMMGHQHLNEVFFDEVLVTPDEVLGAVDHGWEVIRVVLAQERVGIPRYARDERVLAALGAPGDLAEASAGAAQARALVHARTARLLAHRAVGLRAAGRMTDREASTARIASILLDQEVAELALDATAPDGLVPDGVDGLLGQTEDVFRYARASTIASGTVEIQRMLVSRALLMEAADAA